MKRHEENNSAEQTDSKPLLTIEEAGLFLNLKKSRLRYEIFHKKIPYYKIGRSIRFLKKDLIAWVLNQKQEPKRGSK